MKTQKDDLGKWLGSALLALLLQACGGGGGASNAAAGSYLAITGVKQVAGNPVTTICLNNVADATADNAKGQAAAENLARFYFIAGNYKITSSNYQGCASLPGAVHVNVADYNNTILPWIEKNPASSGTGSTSGTGTGTGSGSTVYTQWQNSLNGGGIRDSGGNVFGARASDGQIFHWPGAGVENKLAGFTVSGANLYSAMYGKIGYVGLGDASGGGKIAVLYCTDGNAMGVTVTSSGWYHSCAATGSGSGSGGGSSGTGSETGAGSASSLYGAIAYGSDARGRQYTGVSYDGSDQSSADSLANQQCGSQSGGAVTCGVVLNLVGRGTCGVLAWNDSGWGAATRSSLGDAQSVALGQCQQKTGASCSIAIYACNGR